MAVPDEVLLTPEGLEKLENELNHLKTVRRKEIAERIKAARGFGDLSENSEYDDAKNEQAFVEGQILRIEQMLRNARIVTDDEIDPEVVNLGTTVTVRDAGAGTVATYVIVGSHEGDPSNGRISYQSPVGQALYRRRPGDRVEVQTPSGNRLVLEILEVRQPQASGR